MDSKALARVKKHKGHINGKYISRYEGISISLDNLQSLINNLRNEPNNGRPITDIAFMIGKMTKAEGGRSDTVEYTVEILPYYQFEGRALLFEKGGVEGEITHPWDNSLPHTGGGGGGVNQKTPPPTSKTDPNDR